MKACLLPLGGLLLLAALPAGAAATDAPALAVLTFESSLPDRDGRGDVLADLVAAGLADRFSVVERRELHKVLAEHELNLRGLVAPDQTVQAGKLVGARFLVAGRVFPLGEHVSISVRVIGVDTGRFKGVSFFLPGEPGLDEVARRTVAELTLKLPALQQELLAPAEASGLAAAGRPAPATGPMTAVLNFANLGEGDPEWDWLGKGLADLTIGSLASQDLRVVSREQMQELVHDLEVKKANREPQAVAGVLQASRCVHGTYRVAGGRVELHASILEVKDGKAVHTAAASGPAEKLLDLHQKLAAELADVLKGNRPGTLDPAKLPRWTESLQASQLLYRGIDLFDQGQYLEAWGLFRRALHQDPRYADARYWSGRMMYYLLEYGQARVDLEQFAIEHPRHPRAGDAVMEVINAAQLTATDAEEMLDVLRFAAQLAPHAEVPNQFGPGGSSTVALYVAGLAAQVLTSQRRYREAFDCYAEACDMLPADHPLYWIAWHEMFPLRLKHLKGTGELLPMPPLPRHADLLLALRVNGPRGHRSPGVRVLDDRRISTGVRGLPGQYGMGDLVDDPVDQDFVLLTPAQPSHEWDLSADPLVPCVRPFGEAQTVLTWVTTGTHYFYSDPQHYLAGLDLEVHYRPDPNTPFRLNGSALDNSGIFRQSLPLVPPQRVFGLSLVVEPAGAPPSRPVTTTLAVLSCKVTARFRSGASPSGTLVFRTPPDLPFDVRLEPGGSFLAGETFGTGYEDHLIIEDLAPGPYKVSASPQIRGQNKAAVTTLELAPGETVEVALSARVDPRRKAASPEPWQARRISTPYEAFRLGAALGGGDGKACFFEDRGGRWVVVWSLHHDLYLCTSDDHGRAWSPTRKLPLPVNSAHDEVAPRLCQDLQGRYLLAFASDRNLAHAHKVYFCWSDDLINFSAPVLVADNPGVPLRVLQRANGTYLVYFYALSRYASLGGRQGNHQITDGDCWSVCTSEDLLHWSKPERCLPPSAALEIVEDHGRYLALTEARPLTKTGRLREWVEDNVQTPDDQFRIYTSADGIHFADPRDVPFPPADLMSRGHPAAAVAPFAPGPPTSAGRPAAAVVPTDIACRRLGDRLVMLAGVGPGGVVLASSDGREWKRIAQLGNFNRWGIIRNFGIPEVDQDGVSFFCLPRSKKMGEDVTKVVGPNGFDLVNQPLYLIRYEYDWTPPPQRRGPLEGPPPSMVEARVSKRYRTSRPESRP
jgi:TolB-like protein